MIDGDHRLQSASHHRTRHKNSIKLSTLSIFQTFYIRKRMIKFFFQGDNYESKTFIPLNLCVLKRTRGVNMIEQLYQLCQKELTEWCTLMTHDRSMAEDLVQEAFLRALKNDGLLDSLNEKQQRAWMYRTVKNLYVDKIRHDCRETVTDLLPEQGMEATEYAESDYEMLLSALPEEERMLFTMRYLQGYSSTELGKIFRQPPGTIRSKLSSARKQLKQSLKGDYYERSEKNRNKL